MAREEVRGQREERRGVRDGTGWLRVGVGVTVANEGGSDGDERVKV